jgi:2'-hydroxyisoflavone reductase
VLGPPDPAVELQVVDARDMCPWIVELAERDQPGIYNACGPAEAASWEQVLGALASIAPEPARFHWVPWNILQEHKIELPMVGAPGTPDGISVHFSNAAAQAAGLKFRALADTAAATLAWWRAQPEERRAKARGWPTREQEQAALKRL